MGETPIEVLQQLKSRYRQQMPGRPVPPLAVEGGEADSQLEASLLLISMDELECVGFVPDPVRRPDRLRRPFLERIAVR